MAAEVSAGSARPTGTAGHSLRYGGRMKLRAALIVVMVMIAAAVAAAPAAALEPAGGGWFWQSPVPQGAQLNDVGYGDGVNVWAVGDGGAILHSSDAGVTWHAQSSPAELSLRAVDFVDAGNGWAVGGLSINGSIFGPAAPAAVILHTTDGGQTWTQQTSPVAQCLNDVHFVSVQEGWAVGDAGTVLHTLDAGATWTPQTSGVPGALVSVAFADATHGYASGSSESSGTTYFLSTADGGATWVRVKGQSRYGMDLSSLAVDATGAVWGLEGADGMGNFSNLLRSRDGGAHWRTIEVAGVWGQSLVVAGAGDIWMSGTDWETDIPCEVRSTDSGITWQRRALGNDMIELHAVATNGAGSGCAVGSTIVNSADDGRTWYQRVSDPAWGAANLDFVSATEGWGAFGDASFIWWTLAGVARPITPYGGTLWHTSDGATWAPRTLPTDRLLMDVDFADTEHGWAVGQSGAIVHTDDGGATWTTQASGSTALLGLIDAPTASDGWALGVRVVKRPRPTLKGVVLRTTDGGASWDHVALPDSFVPLEMSFISSTQGWVVGAELGPRGITAMTCLHTVDGGATWQDLSFGALTTGAVLSDVQFTDAQHGWVVGYRSGGSVVLSTDDGGVTWTDRAAGSALAGQYLSGVRFVGPDVGWVSGMAGIFQTTDGGATWTRQTRGGGLGMPRVAAFDATHAWAASGYEILSTVDATGDTVPPVTLADSDNGWHRTAVTVSLMAADVGGSGLASTEYKLDGAAAWQPYAGPLDFPAPADHSGDGRHTLLYRSTDNAGHVELAKVAKVDIDTVAPVTRARASLVGHSGIARFIIRIDDRSCPSVDNFDIEIRDARGRRVSGYGSEGDSLRTGRWLTVREELRFLPAGRYRFSVYTHDRAGNKQRKAGSATLIVARHKMLPLPGSVASAAARSATPAFRPATRAGSAPTSPAWLPEQIRALLSRVPAGLPLH